MAVCLVDVSSYLPGEPVGTEYFTRYSRSDRMAKNVMFRSPRHRHHVSLDDTSVELVDHAVAPLLQRHGADALADVDVLLTHQQLPDNPLLGCGPEVARRLGMRPDWVYDLHNGGCAAFVLMLQTARMILEHSSARSALLVTVQNCAGQAFTQPTVRGLAHAPVPGDGIGVGLLRKFDDVGTEDGAPPLGEILAVECRTYPEFAGDMEFTTNSDRKWWQPRESEGCVNFSENKIAKVLSRGNRLVPEVALAVCDRIGVRGPDVDVFVTNQPNRLFLRNWREAMELPPQRHPDTFDECGNLFASGIPVTLDTENRAGRIPDGALVVMSAFAHAGDFAGAAAVRWGAAP
ncbi:MAG: 3-oxoacyl-ACP synthase [Mycobacteriaceae bacterium]|nr:3-oxoacyl-ACP synthase [Mycobacteriaceae bacterium]